MENGVKRRGYMDPGGCRITVIGRLRLCSCLLTLTLEVSPLTREVVPDTMLLMEVNNNHRKVCFRWILLPYTALRNSHTNSWSACWLCVHSVPACPVLCNSASVFSSITWAWWNLPSHDCKRMRLDKPWEGMLKGEREGSFFLSYFFFSFQLLYILDYVSFKSVFLI